MSSRRVLRGGCWGNTPDYLRSPAHMPTRDTQNRYYGFRLVREPESHRMLRGGAWVNGPACLVCAGIRISIASWKRLGSVGFRLVREPK